MSAPPVRIESKAWTDTRYDTLALHLGCDFDHALMGCVKVWRWQTEHFTDDAPTYVVHRAVIDGALKSLKGAEALVAADLAVLEPDGRLRIRGGRDDKGKSRIDWLFRDRERNREKGRARHEKATRDGGRFVAAGADDQPRTSRAPAAHQPDVGTRPAEPQPATSSLVSDLRTPEIPDLSLSAGAREPADPDPAPAFPAFAPLEPLVSLAIDQLNAARSAIDPDAPPIAALGDAAGVRSLLDRLRPLPERDREPTLRRAIAVLVETVRAKGWPVGELRLGQLAGERAWSQWLAGTVKSVREAARRDSSRLSRDRGPVPLPAVGKGPAPVVVPAAERAAAAAELAASKRALGIGIVEPPPAEPIDDDPDEVSDAIGELKQRLAANGAKR